MIPETVCNLYIPFDLLTTLGTEIPVLVHINWYIKGMKMDDVKGRVYKIEDTLVLWNGLSHTKSRDTEYLNEDRR